ncbi:MAG: 50S ribosomal protein L6 [Erysipelotrichaceae bacterium]|nr:50S ribosomal protein L6 [Erysipelotrichaceae bacterium]MDD4641940.1 50S ribosomal protein L6 [Erysipelotrichaceae bacterium]
MSRIGNKTITIPAGVEVEITAANEVTVKGPKGSLTRQFNPALKIENNDGIITVSRPNDEKHIKQLHGTTRALINNMIVGVSEGYAKSLEIVGIGYRAAVEGQKLTINIGYSKPVVIIAEDDVKVECKTPTEIIISGIDKQRVGELASNIRAVRKPEPYLGKGIRYKGEKIRRKEGKTAAKS